VEEEQRRKTYIYEVIMATKSVAPFAAGRCLWQVKVRIPVKKTSKPKSKKR
jgi:hypothetical protein